MNAVITKPRAKRATAPKQAAPTASQLLADLKAQIDRAAKIISATLEGIFHEGTHCVTLLDLLDSKLLPEARGVLDEVPLTQGAAERSYEAFFPAIAALGGVIALAPDSVVMPALRNALQVLDDAHDKLDSAGPLSRLLPVAVESVPSPVQMDCSVSVASDDEQAAQKLAWSVADALESLATNECSDLAWAVHSLTHHAHIELDAGDAQEASNLYVQALAVLALVDASEAGSFFFIAQSLIEQANTRASALLEANA